MKSKCPICGNKFEAKQKESPGEEKLSEFFPFCSERCRFVDLGAWLDEKYQVHRPVEQEEGD